MLESQVKVLEMQKKKKGRQSDIIQNCKFNINLLKLIIKNI